MLDRVEAVVQLPNLEEDFLNKPLTWRMYPIIWATVGALMVY